jgi:DNA-binding response OmpR family regulator
VYDEPDTTLALRMGLEQQVFEVEGYNNSIKILSKFKINHCDLLLNDMRMSTMNCFKLYKKNRKFE